MTEIYNRKHFSANLHGEVKFNMIRSKVKYLGLFQLRDQR